MSNPRLWQRTEGQFIPNGATATSFNQGETFTIPGVAGKGLSVVGITTDIELYVRCTATGSNLINSSIWEETVMVVGVELYPSTAGELISSTPLANPNANPAALHDWGQWNYLYPELMNIDFNAPEVATVVWRPREGSIRTDTRRSVGVGVGIDVWLAWDVQDGASLINGTHGGVTYNLGARFAQQVVYEYKS